MDYRDRTIHKLLKSITDSYRRATTNGSIYYKKGSIRIRFSDHYSEHNFLNFEIVKLSNGCYYFADRDFGIAACFYREDILKFLKNYFSIRDLFANQIKSLRASLKKANNEIKKVKLDLNNAELKSNLELADSIYEENKNLKNQIKDIKAELANFEGKLLKSNRALMQASDLIKNACNTIKI